MIRDALQLLFDTHKKSITPEYLEIGDVPYMSIAGSMPAPMIPPRAKPIGSHTLGAVVNYLRNALSGTPTDFRMEPMEDLVLIIEPTFAAISTNLHPTLRDREILLTSAPWLPDHSFGRELSQEDAVVWLRTGFEQTPELEGLLQIVGNLRAGTITTVVDDGVSQQVSVFAGVKRGNTAEAPSIINLRPYRTFAEIPQPESPFVLRFRGGEDVPRMVLYPTADVSWKLNACAAIERFITDAIGEEMAASVLILR